MMATVIFATACGTKKQSQMMDGQFEAVYLGVQGYGEEETNKDNKESFLYRFDIKGAESIFSIDNGTKDEEGEYDYPIQNALKEGYRYQITVNDGIVVAAEETEETQKEPETIVSGQPGDKTLKNFLQTALMPVGTTLYIYGGGWDWQDVGSSVQTRTGQPGGGVQLSALNKDSDKDCEAYKLADKYMSTYYPEWYERYETAVKDSETYFSFEGEKAGLFIWDVIDGNGLTDPDGIQNMSPEEVLKVLFPGS